MKSLNTFGTLSEVEVKGTKYKYHSLPALEKKIGKKMETLPFSIRVLLENLLRYEDGAVVTKGDVEALINWDPKKTSDKEIQFRPARVILQDFTGVPVVADLAAMRAAMKKWGGDPLKINPLQPVDLVVDHSVQVDYFGTADALQKNSNLEFQRNQERYEFLKWAQASFKNFTVVPPATGIVHQVNLEYLARVAMTQATDAGNFIFPDTVIGTDSHTPMVNGLGVVGWGVGGIEAEAAMLGQPCTMLIPDVVGFRLKGKMPAGTTATDLVLTVVQMLRKKGVVGKFVEFFGPGCLNLSVADRATISNMAPEYGATIGIFPIDQKTLDFLKLTNREEKAQLTEAYYKAQGMFFNESTPDPVYSDVLELDLATLEPSLAGPARPQDRTSLAKVNESFRNFMKTQNKDTEIGVKTADVTGQNYKLGHGSVVIAAITSCTNTSNPSVMIGAGLLAKKAVEKGLTVKPWVKTSLAPGSKVVTEYLKSSGLLSYLEKLNFNVVGYGCTTCIGNSGPLPEAIQDSVLKNDLSVASVLSGNRNFEARVHPHVRANYLASPPLVVAYALAGSVNMDLTKEPIGTGADGKPVFLNDIFPTSEEVEQFVHKNVTLDKFKSSYGDVFKGSSEWQAIKVEGGDLYKWDAKSTYIKEPPYFDGLEKRPTAVKDFNKGRALLVVGDSVTTDHISPAGDIGKNSVAGEYLGTLGIKKEDFNSYGARRGNHEIMIRGTFANVRIKNKMIAPKEGPMTMYIPSGEVLPVATVAEMYRKDGTPLLVLGGKEYGSGSSRDWAAKGPALQGVRVAIAESYERIHRSNLIGMGILPLQFMPGESVESLGLTGFETFDITGLSGTKVRDVLTVNYTTKDGQKKSFKAQSRIDTPNELAYYQNGGILQYVLRDIGASI